MAWGVAFYRSSTGNVPAREFLDTCPANVRRKLLVVLEVVRAAPPQTEPRERCNPRKTRDVADHLHQAPGLPGRSIQAEGKTRMEALRCLKRHLARRVHHTLTVNANAPANALALT